MLLQSNRGVAYRKKIRKRKKERMKERTREKKEEKKKRKGRKEGKKERKMAFELVIVRPQGKDLLKQNAAKGDGRSKRR
jgi:hypothetical protein